MMLSRKGVVCGVGFPGEFWWVRVSESQYAVQMSYSERLLIAIVVELFLRQEDSFWLDGS